MAKEDNTILATAVGVEKGVQDAMNGYLEEAAEETKTLRSKFVDCGCSRYAMNCVTFTSDGNSHHSLYLSMCVCVCVCVDDALKGCGSSRISGMRHEEPITLWWKRKLMLLPCAV